MREPLVALVLLTSAVAVVAISVDASADAASAVGPKPWQPGISWRWSDGSTFQETRVTEERRIETQWGSYDSWMTQTRRVDDEGTEYVQVSAWMKDSHRRVYDEVHIYESGQESRMVTTTYNPPTAFPVWETIRPGGSFYERVTTTTRQMVGMTPAGGEQTEWHWAAWADPDVYNLTTPSGTYEGFNVTVMRSEVDGDQRSTFRYFYAPEAHHFAATFAEEDEVDFQLTELNLNPAPIPHADVTPPLPEVGQEVTLDASRSFDRNGHITSYRWTLPDGTAFSGPNITVRFDEPGPHRVLLNLTDDGHRSIEVPVTVEVIDRAPNFKIAGPSVTNVEEGTSFRLVPPEDREIRRATWRTSGFEPRSGPTVEYVFPDPGRYNVTVTYVDKNGTTGRASHVVNVVGASGSTGAGAVNVSQDAVGADLAPGILSPASGTRIDQDEVLVVVRLQGLEDPALVLPNGLRVPFETSGSIGSAQVPLSGDEVEIRLVDGDRTVDRIVLQHVDDDLGADAANVSGPDGNDMPFPGIAALLSLLAAIPLATKRRRQR